MPGHIHGFHSIEEALKGGEIRGKLLYSRAKGRCADLIALAGRAGVRAIHVNDADLDRYCDRKKHRGAVLVYEGDLKKTVTHKTDAHPPRDTGNREDLKSLLPQLDHEGALVLVLDEITDPHNYGAILRCADQFGADLVITPRHHSARETETVASTSAGAHIYVRQLIVPNIAGALDTLKDAGFWVYGADMGGEPVDAVDFAQKTVLVMGSEGKGMRRLVKESCDVIVGIPSRGKIDSLNVSVATGIILYEIRRQGQKST